MNFKVIDGGICASKGFKASGIYCGIKRPANDTPETKHKNDICIFVSDTVCNTAAVYTQNKVKGAPILVTKKNLEKSGNKSIAVIANSKNANTCNADGIEKAEAMCELLAKELNIPKEQVIVASTGVIGQILPIEPIKTGIPKLVKELDYNKNIEAATAIMTTDTVKKEYAIEFEIDGIKCHLGGMAKGSGMIHPNMATTLNFITTDCAISSNLLQEALSEIVKVTYNCLSIDGDTSTNDMVSLMANGMADNKEITSHGADFDTFKSALYEIMANLTRMLAKDGEGATKLIECITSGAKDKDTAITVAKSVVCSSLFKAAIFGEDANWGRILCAVGYAQADFDINKVDVDLKSKNGIISVCKNGSGIEFSEEKASEILSADEIYVLINLNDGSENATAWGCDLTYDYVKINGDYRT
ncbi:MAG: bifunctional glutamate N-acetyltransferase/amino-acid acetyltransferase ArgJ [Eubacterium coprostanoligenes]|uniref:bifunctional glutamate N-acetyltransferase/amino-acid acetyltransferase ArgJ n=1 Tax=Eubacterium coprostanoligenes TaxID=290054 RepID=UPI002409E284|nr:bifunctional glutamate N-acetyltransferase/amino-acid acetyltransferase ArgJ [Eubacterium coprostanoligenes]MDD6666104.1 bifunctional glutamate N-acetyltransferase/amino-acid acetyltransferase ArgJ [Eubacterium coprostanoligenes]